jgi:hypothetical protein
VTIPVDVKGKYLINIKDVYTTDNSWRIDHWNQLTQAYKKAPHFDVYEARFKELYLKDDERNLSQINFKFISHVNDLLNIVTPIRWGMEFETPIEKSERLLSICKQLNATTYISGAAAKDYLNVSLFERNDITVEWADYSNYPEYAQLHPPFTHEVSVLDLLFHEGQNAKQFLKAHL